ncbi:MAG: BCD family MFS transporter [Parvularcula sp.]|jgi:BCD family chlorophyll transporter-like MFS transporter|nr:BCD family MFS transporter [Parvularcula sp.]
MTKETTGITAFYRRLGPGFLPFADALSEDLPFFRLLRLSLFQLSVGMSAVLLTGTLNRVMIVELSVPAWIVSAMVSLPLLFAPFRALIGHRSDMHRSAFGWRRGPFIWFGSLLQFGGLAIMPFALFVLSGDATGHFWVGYVAAALAFLMVGAGMHTVQTAGLALATDISSEDARPRVVALLYVMLLLGMAISALLFGLVLRDFTQLRLVQIIQGAALVTMLLNMAALWKQEARRPQAEAGERSLDFLTSWRGFTSRPGARRLLAATGIGAAAFAMQDVLLEPYGGEVLGMSVSGTTSLTAVFALGSILGFALPARWLARAKEPHRIAAMGILLGVTGFTAVVLSTVVGGQALFVSAVGLIGVGGGLFAVCTLISAMGLAEDHGHGIALGAWGAVQASCTGIAIAIGGAVRDVVSFLADQQALGPALTSATPAYDAVYITEIVLLFAALAVIGPLAKHSPDPQSPRLDRLRIEAFPN